MSGLKFNVSASSYVRSVPKTEDKPIEKSKIEFKVTAKSYTKKSKQSTEVIDSNNSNNSNEMKETKETINSSESNEMKEKEQKEIPQNNTIFSRKQPKKTSEKRKKKVYEEKEQMKHEIEELKTQLSMKDNEILQLKQQIEEMKKEMKQKQHYVDTKTYQIEKMKKEMENKTNEINELTDENEQLKKEIDEMNNYEDEFLFDTSMKTIDVEVDLRTIFTGGQITVFVDGMNVPLKIERGTAKGTCYPLTFNTFGRIVYKKDKQFKRVGNNIVGTFKFPYSLKGTTVCVPTLCSNKNHLITLVDGSFRMMGEGFYDIKTGKVGNYVITVKLI